MSDQPRPTPSLEDLDDLEERIKDGQPIGIGNVLDIARDMRRESDARAERIAELDGKLLKLYEVYGEHLYFLRAPSMQDGFRIAAENIKELRAENAKLREALERIKNGENAPDIDIGGEAQFGLHCGVEDKSCRDRYEGADYGYSRGVEAALEWAANEASQALAGKEEG